MSVLTRLLNRPGGDHLVVEPMRRRNLAAVMAIESVSYPKKREPTLKKIHPNYFKIDQDWSIGTKNEEL